MKTLIREAARAQGFDPERVGFASTEPSPHSEYLDEWLARGANGTMGWFTRNPEHRKDIRKRYRWAKSYVVLEIPYASGLPVDTPKGSALHGIARYARDLDYHDVYKPRLKALQEAVKKVGPAGTKAMWYQDTGPFLERLIASQSGLGWVGKNTMLIDPMRGSWFFLALVVTSLELTPDAPEPDHCGTCTRCIDACPTDAFPEPYRMDSNKCISYLTIEHKGDMDAGLADRTGEWIFGCDICNAVCPWNSKDANEPANVPEGLRDLTLAKILHAKPEHLQKRLVGTPLERTGEARLKRNAAVVAGNVGDASLLVGLEQSARHEDAMVRRAVIRAYCKIGTDASRGALARMQKFEVDDDVREQVIDALMAWGESDDD